MQLHSIIELMLNEAKSVFIPSLGVLKFENNEVVLDKNGNGSVLSLLNVIAEKNSISTEEAEKWLDEQLLDLKGKSSIPIGSYGTFTKEDNGEFTFGKKKANIFPTDFFSSKPIAEVEEEIESSEHNNITEVIEDNESKIEIIEDEVEETVSEVEETPEPEEQKSSILDKAKGLFGSSVKNIEEVVENAADIVEDVVENVVDTADDVLEDVVEKVEEVADSVEEKIEEVIEDNHPEEIHDEIEEIVEDPIIETPDIQHEEIENKFFSDDSEQLVASDIYMEEPILTLDEEGMNEYDRGYYNHLLQHSAGQQQKSWGRVAGILGLVALVGFFLPWLYKSFNGDSYLGMPPMWGESAKEEVKEEKIIVKKDEVLSDTTSIDSVMDNTTTEDNSDVLLAQQNDISTDNTSDKTSTGSQMNTSSKKSSSSSSSSRKTTNANSTSSNTSKSNYSSGNTFSISSGSSNQISKDVKAAADGKEHQRKKVSKNVTGGPYATANYSKGNHYVSFGAFRVPKNARNLRTDLKKAGVVTDVVMVDGMYKVVIPYVSKKHALKAASEFGNTTVFQ